MLPADTTPRSDESPCLRRALIVDPDRAACAQLAALLLQTGYEVVVAASGRDAVDRFQAAPVDLVLFEMDVLGAEGIEPARRIKALSSAGFVPVVFVGRGSGSATLARAIDAGGDDFLDKPYDELAVRARIRALERIRTGQRNAARLHARAHVDWEIAQTLLGEAVMGSNPRTSALCVDLTPTDTYSADVFLAEHCPSGDLNLLLGDFTGHGLASALAALPTAEIFRSMTSKGFAPQQILLEINRKLRAHLPTGKFLAASFVRVSRSLQRIWVANCGMPDVMIVCGNEIRERIRSGALPLGVHAELDLGDCLRPVAVTEGERLLLTSDGVHEAANARGDQFGVRRLETAVASARCAGSLVARIRAALDEHRGDQPLADDSSVVEVRLAPALFETPQTSAVESGDAIAPVDSSAQWHMAIDLHADALRVSDPVPMLLSQLQEIPGLDEHRSALYTVLSELYSNALEHGVLQLSSTLKEQPEGFERYLEARESLLASLREGWVRIRCVCAQWPGGGQILINVHDSGTGFDWASYPAEPPAGPHGRGLYLVRGLCRSLAFEGCGNDVRATYGWGTASRYG